MVLENSKNIVEEKGFIQLTRGHKTKGSVANSNKPKKIFGQCYYIIHSTKIRIALPKNKMLLVQYPKIHKYIHK